MKRSASFLFGFALCAVAAFGQSELEVRNRIVGTWKLVSAEETMKDGTARPFPGFGPRAKGFLMYQRDGYMCAEMVNSDRPIRSFELSRWRLRRAAVKHLWGFDGCLMVSQKQWRREGRCIGWQKDWMSMQLRAAQ
jgi:hypothetical protein